MKKVAVAAALVILIFQGSLQAQEREPLAMRIMAEWTFGGVFVGAIVGAALWLTDPGKANNRLTEQVAGSAAWGAVAGAGFALTVLNDTLILPLLGQVSRDPLHASRRISSDPILQEERRQDLLATAGGGARAGPGIVLPLFAFRF